ncbi:MAG: FHA domain-containing protein [Deltaproteobacteria bacterium]|nr:FHA domain-containing protein [Deltaproteobacteria bacterium]
MGVLISVQVYRGDQLVAQHQFDSDVNRTIKIGRLSSAQIKLEDPRTSRIHAVIELGANDITLHDMGTTEGTSVNGAKVVNAKLKNGDQVTIGDTTLVITMGAVASASPTVAAANATAPNNMAASFNAAGPAFGAPPAFAAKSFAAPGIPKVDWGPATSFGAPQVASPATANVSATATPAASPPTTRTAQQLRFDPGSNSGPIPIRRITNERLGAAAVESKPHPALAPERPMSAENRVLEMRLYWGEVLLGISHYSKPKKITIGETKKTDVFISSEGLPVEEFPLVRYIDNEYVLTFTRHMEGEVEVGGQLGSLQTLCGSSHARKDDHLSESYQVRMAADSRAIVHWGGATFALRFVVPPEPLQRHFWKDLDLHFINVALLSLFFHLALVVTLLVYPYDTESLREDLFDKPDRFASLILEPPKQSETNKNLLENLKKEVERKKEEITKKIEQEKPKKVKPDPLKVAKFKPPVKVRPRTQEEKSEAVKRKFSKLFAGGGGGGNAPGSILGGGGGGSLSGTLSNVIGTAGRGSATAGMAGLGIRGTGPLTGGGVGTSRGIAGIGTSGRLGGGGLAYGSNVGLGGRKNRSALQIGPPRIEGALDPAVIKKVIDQNRNQIRYCYEKELNVHQNLEGRVAMTWIISATGSVAKVMVRDSTLKNANVEDCIKKKILNWKFPAPAGGGIVTVNYPFIFKAT